MSASVLSLAHPFSICLISFNFTLQPDSYDPHPTQEPLSPLVKVRKHIVKYRFLTLAHLFGTVCFKHSVRRSDSPSSLKTAFITHLFNNYFYTVFFTAVSSHRNDNLPSTIVAKQEEEG